MRGLDGRDYARTDAEEQDRRAEENERARRAEMDEVFIVIHVNWSGIIHADAASTNLGDMQDFALKHGGFVVHGWAYPNTALWNPEDQP